MKTEKKKRAAKNGSFVGGLFRMSRGEIFSSKSSCHSCGVNLSRRGSGTALRLMFESEREFSEENRGCRGGSTSFRKGEKDLMIMSIWSAVEEGAMASGFGGCASFSASLAERPPSACSPRIPSFSGIGNHSRSGERRMFSLEAFEWIWYTSLVKEKNQWLRIKPNLDFLIVVFFFFFGVCPFFFWLSFFFFTLRGRASKPRKLCA